jgi:hypothetical protein
MREDMFKVIVERPRMRIPQRNGSHYPRGQLKNEFAHDFEDSPRRESYGSKRYAEKWLNENLSPLKRYLRRQVGRNWDEVFSEISEHLRLDNTVQRHVFEHIDGYVYMKTWLDHDGDIWGSDPLGRPVPINPQNPSSSSYAWHWDMLFVDPRTRLLRKCDERRSRPRLSQAKLSEQKNNPARRVLSDYVQLHRIGEIWFRVELAVLPKPATPRRNEALPPLVCYDVVLKRYVDLDIHHAGSDVGRLYGRPDRYAISKKQMSKREKLRYLG